MKLHLVLIVCCAVTIFAAPVKEENEDDVKAKGKISVEVKPIDLQVKLTPVKIQAKLGEKKSIVTTSTTTEPTTIEPTEADESKESDEPVKPTKFVRPTATVNKVIKKNRTCKPEFQSKVSQFIEDSLFILI